MQRWEGHWHRVSKIFLTVCSNLALGKYGVLLG